MKTQIVLLFLISSLFLTCSKLDDCERHFKNDPIPILNRICFGSCSGQNTDQPILNTVVGKSPDLFIYLGDNVYADTKSVREMEKAYLALCQKSVFRQLISSVKTIATWDDHDYGENDAGKNYCMKKESKNIFMKFWGELGNNDRQMHEGIYTDYYFGDSAHRVQVILLDCRTFRDDLLTNAGGYYIPNPAADATMLGTAQWNWLKSKLEVPAQIRIIGSSTQFARSYQGYESWANFPLEQVKMAETIRDAKANGVFFISGDMHLAELSKISPANLYPLYDLTSSGLTQLEGSDIANTNRVGDVELDYNFGKIDIDWQDMTDVKLNLAICKLNGAEVLNYVVHLNELKQ